MRGARLLLIEIQLSPHPTLRIRSIACAEILLGVQKLKFCKKYFCIQVLACAFEERKLWLRLMLRFRKKAYFCSQAYLWQEQRAVILRSSALVQQRMWPALMTGAERVCLQIGSTCYAVPFLLFICVYLDKSSCHKGGLISIGVDGQPLILAIVPTPFVPSICMARHDKTVHVSCWFIER